MEILDDSQLRNKGIGHACIMKGRYWDLIILLTYLVTGQWMNTSKQKSVRHELGA